MVTDLKRTMLTGYSDITEHAIDTAVIDSIRDQEETYDYNNRAQTDWGMVKNSPKIFSAISMAAIWTVGKGWICDLATEERIKLIDGNGKQTFKDILYSMEFTKRAMRDAYSLIIWNDPVKRDWPLNLIVLDAMYIRKAFDNNGRIIGYDQMRPMAGSSSGMGRSKSAKAYNFGGSEKCYHRYDPRDIFHLSNDCVAGSMHGISVPEKLEKYILADDESFVTIKKASRFQAVPFIIFKVKEDNAATIASFKANIKDARENGEDLIVPDDTNILSWEVVQTNPSSFLLDWRAANNQDLFRAVGMPLVLFGGAGTTEADGKVGYLGHETVFENNQLTVEQQIEMQLHLKIELNSPTSLLEQLKMDETKDAQNAISFQPQDAQGGRNN